MALLDVERPLALFAEGIAGRPHHIRPSEQADDPLAAEPGADGRSVYLPEAIDVAASDAVNSGIYRLLALEQLGFAEFGTFRFDMARAKVRIPALADWPLDGDSREPALAVFFAGFEQAASTPRSVARQVFRIVETARVQAAVGHRYPGTRRYRHALGQGDLAQTLAAALETLPAREPLLPLAIGVLAPEADVYASAAATIACCRALVPAGSPAIKENADGPALETLQRQARLEDWQEALEEMDSEAAAMEFAADAAAGEEITVAEGQNEAGEIREAAADLAAERDRLKRRIDLERASVRHAAGEERRGESFRYDEWDCHQGRYLRGWCRLYEERLQAEADADGDALLRAVRPHLQAVRRRFENIRPAGYQRVKKTPDGDELDLEAVVATRVDLVSGVSPDERVHSRRERLRRDVAAALLVDLSASTDDIVPAEREQPTATAARQDIRDPYFDDDEYDFAARLAEDAAKRRVINIQQEAVLLMATALESLGDRYGVYGFSGYGREGVEFYVAKEFDDALDQAALDAIAAMKPKRSTRMGPAIRHAAAKLAASGAALKVLLIVSDGFPQDHDYGPQRGEHEYGVQDTARALVEAQGQGIEPFCVTVDCAEGTKEDSHDYLRRMCPEQRYMVIAETDALPGALQKAYRRLTNLA